MSAQFVRFHSHEPGVVVLRVESGDDQRASFYTSSVNYFERGNSVIILLSRRNSG